MVIKVVVMDEDEAECYEAFVVGGNANQMTPEQLAKKVRDHIAAKFDVVDVNSR